MNKGYQCNIVNEYQEKSIIFNQLNYFLNYYMGKLDFQDFINTFSIQLLFSKKYKKSDILHFHNLHGNYFGILSLPILTKNKKIIWTLHDMWAFTGHCAHSLDCNKFEKQQCKKCNYINIYPAMKKDRANTLFKFKHWIYKHSDFDIVVPSKWLEKQVRCSMLKNKRIHYIPNGIDINVFKKYDKQVTRQRLGLPKDKIILLFSADGGNKNPWKGPKYLLEAIKNINSSNWREKVLFLNIGGNSTRQDNYISKRYIKSENLMAQYYSSADLYIFPTLADNAPLTVLEAMACGLPVVTFNTGGVPEIVKHMETGYVSAYKDQQDFNKGIYLLLNNTELREDMSKKAIEVIHERFTIDLMVKHYINLYNQILGI
ncbi:MAG: glycosyltransferase [Epulopiscium sp.]|nr:glycosyltransferase [Candidatus Epulonipiscium sp.]